MEIKRELRIPIVAVTHDLPQAAISSDQILVVEKGQTDSDWTGWHDSIGHSCQEEKKVRGVLLRAADSPYLGLTQK